MELWQKLRGLSYTFCRTGNIVPSCLLRPHVGYTPSVQGSVRGLAAAVNVMQLVVFDNNQFSVVVDSSVARFSATLRRTLSVTAGRDDNVLNSHSTAAASQHVRRRARTQITVHQAVDCEVEAGVQVGYHRRVQVNGQRQTVRAVVVRITTQHPAVLRSELSYSSTTMYGLQQQKNATKMTKTVFTWRIACILAA